MEKKERTRRALWREPVDRLPVQVSYTPAMGRSLAEHFAISLDELPARLDNHLLRLDISFRRRAAAAGTALDWWGAGWSTQTEGYWPTHAPLAETTDLAAFDWPDPDEPDLLAEAQRTLEADQGAHFVVPNLGFALFERAWSLRGFDQLLMDMVTETAWVEELLERITLVQIRLARRFVALGVDGGYIGDDYGAQKSMLFSPKLWRKLIKPRLARLFAVFRDAGLPVILHSDGDIQGHPARSGGHRADVSQPGTAGGARALLAAAGVRTAPELLRRPLHAGGAAEAGPGGGPRRHPRLHRRPRPRRHRSRPRALAPDAVGHPGNERGRHAGGVSRGRPMKEDPGRAARVGAAFAERFGGEPSTWCRAPGRVDLMGSHTDYNLGFVLTLPIGRDTWIAARPRRDRSVRVHSLNLDEDCVLQLDDLVPRGPRRWGDYVGGVAAVLQAEGLATSGWEGVVHGTVPIGSGLSSSAALECAVATVFEVLGGWTMEPVRKARLCQRAENEFVGVQCGILDQYTSCVGQEGCALLLDCRDLSSRPVELPDDIRVVICDTRSRRELAASEYGTRRAQCEEGARRLGVGALREVSVEQLVARESALPPDVARRCRFIVEENDRVRRLARALPAGDRSAIREACAGSFRGAVELYEIGAPAMELMMAAMMTAPGVIGARQAGAGFGGCMVALVDAERVGPFADAVDAAYREAGGVEPVIDPVGPGAGAGVIQPPPSPLSGPPRP